MKFPLIIEKVGGIVLRGWGDKYQRGITTTTTITNIYIKNKQQKNKFYIYYRSLCWLQDIALVILIEKNNFRSGKYDDILK